MAIEILLLAGGLVALWVIIKVFSLPARLLCNGIIGALTLWLLNFVGAGFGLTLPINVVSALIAGVFGLPGIVFLLLYKYFF
jgi:inhibitor of the pro-sigma K processing machinery